MTTLGHGRQRTADWDVVAVFDPEGEGHDFAYTVGLHDRGLPELHVWGRPSLGDDPGADWMFGPQDRTRLLNELAWRLVDGELEVGETWEERYDAGLVTVRFQLDPPGDRNELEALGIAPEAQVLPVRWSLHRRPVGRPRGLTTRGLRRATAEYTDILGSLGGPVLMPDDWELPTSFVPGGRFGPLTPMVAARVAEFWSADAITLSNLMWAAITAEAGGSLTWPATFAAATARECGRVDEVEGVQAAATGVVRSRLARANWSTTLRELSAAMELEPGDVRPDQLSRGCEHRFTELLWTVLSTEVVADRLTSAQRLHGRGAWLTGLGPVGELPGPQWRAPRRVLDRLTELLRPLSFSELLVLVMRHQGTDEDYRSVADRAHGWAVVSAAGCPWRGVLDRLPGIITPGRIEDLQGWATVMTSAATHRDRLSADDVAALTAPFLDLLPELPAAIAG